MFDRNHSFKFSGLIGAAISDLSRRLSKIEDAANAQKPPMENQPVVGVLKAVINWPAFGIVALALFCAPLYGLFNALAVKLCTADEVKVWEVSFTRRLETSALKLGDAGLAETIPKLSADAVDVLLRGIVSSRSIVRYSYVEDDAKLVKDFSSPTVSALKAIFELRDNGLVEITNSPGPTDAVRFWSEVDELRKRYHAVELPYGESDTVNWAPSASSKMRVVDLPKTHWKLTDRGKKASETIVDAVQKELAGAPPSSKCLKLIGA